MCAEETWRILISDDVGSGGAGAAQGGSGGEDEATTQARTKEFQERSMQLFGWFKPFVITGGIFYMLYQHSQIVSNVMATIGKILGAIMDVILLPLMPLFVAVVNAIVPLIPIIQKMSDAFFKPIVDFLVGKVNAFANWVMNTVDWDAIERWLKHAGETVTGWIETVFNWLSGPFYHWWCDHAYPWLVKEWQKFYNWITNMDWGALWDNIKKIPGLLADGFVAVATIIGVLIGAVIGGFSGGLLFGGAGALAGAAAGGLIFNAQANDLVNHIKDGLGLSESQNLTNTAEGSSGGGQPGGLQTGGYIYNSGRYLLHAGERVINENENKYGGSGVQMTNTFNIELALTGTVDDLAREIESKITDKLTNIMRRA